jgi:(p)ppGpp synthase/HD superfamily hydrolase
MRIKPVELAVFFYVTDLLSVTALILESAETEEEAIAALLHDAIEHQGGSKFNKI